MPRRMWTSSFVSSARLKSWLSRGISFLGAAGSLGIAVPADVSLVGIDNIPYGRFTRPTLTTVDIHSEHQGEEAMRMLLRAIAGTDAPTSHVKVEPRLVMRESTRVREPAAAPARRASTPRRPLPQ